MEDFSDLVFVLCIDRAVAVVAEAKIQLVLRSVLASLRNPITRLARRNRSQDELNTVSRL